MQVNKSVGILLAAAGSLSHVATSQAQELDIRPLPIAAIQPAPDNSVALALPVAATANPQAAALPIQQLWTLTAGDTVGQNLSAWAEKVGWKVMWSLPGDWVIPNTASFSGSFADAAQSVIETLADNGALVRARIREDNKTIVIFAPGAAQQ